jgi:hypothetical protein
LFLVVFAGCLVLVAAIVGFVDPYDRFGGAGDVPRRLGAQTNQVLLAMIEVRKIPASSREQAQVVIFGDSRARKLSEERLFQVSGQPALNLGIGGASFEETLTWLDSQASQLPGMRVLIVATPFERFCAAPAANTAVEAQPIARHTYRYLLNVRLLRQSLGLLMEKPSAAGAKPKASAPADILAARDESVRATWRRLFSGYEAARATRRVESLLANLAPVQGRGIKVVFWCPPLRPDVGRFIPELGLEAERQRIASLLAATAPLVDMTHASELGGTPLIFTDPVHNQNGPAITEHLVATALRGASPILPVPASP